jgi:hypothetical protein
MPIEVIRSGGIMRTSISPSQTRAFGSDPDSDSLVDRLRELPELQALEFYSQLSPRLQWLARQRTTGQRQAALIAHHLLTAGGCR